MSDALLAASLRRFYQDHGNADILEEVATGRSDVSLRLVEWYVSTDRDVHLDYQVQLRAYTRRLFDPFRRSDRVVLTDYESRTFETTLGQMNFFKWMIEERHWERLNADRVALNERMMGDAKTKRPKARSRPAVPLAPFDAGDALSCGAQTICFG